MIEGPITMIGDQALTYVLPCKMCGAEGIRTPDPLLPSVTV